jgi:hypothetical protein
MWTIGTFLVGAFCGLGLTHMAALHGWYDAASKDFTAAEAVAKDVTSKGG